MENYQIFGQKSIQFVDGATGGRQAFSKNGRMTPYAGRSVRALYFKAASMPRRPLWKNIMRYREKGIGRAAIFSRAGYGGFRYGRGWQTKKNIVE